MWYNRQNCFSILGCMYTVIYYTVIKFVPNTLLRTSQGLCYLISTTYDDTELLFSSFYR